MKVESVDDSPQARANMDLPEEDLGFLSDLVKASRQRVHHVAWTDRDGTPRQTALTPAEVVRVNVLAQRLGISKSELLRQAAHIPVAQRRKPKDEVPTKGEPAP